MHSAVITKSAEGVLYGPDIAGSGAPGLPARRRERLPVLGLVRHLPQCAVPLSRWARDCCW
ncbi:hypothetical protein ABZU75_45275 [Streptosporangium sp. NPDC005286]|uniref:hypothetical protein n=1 Tax=Streptosporangium sp. NPDC005286 TaxID=3154463 RepID=UPI0033B19D41